MGTTAQKLEKLLQNKQELVNIVNEKAGTNYTIDSKLSDIINSTKNISGGIDTSDGDVTASDILLGKVAYAKEERIVGTIEDYDGENVENLENVSSLKKLLDYTKFTKYMFQSNTTITDLTGLIEYNDTENVTNMYQMFQGCSNLTSIPLLDTSKVTDMGSMFYGCSKITTIPLLNTSNVTNMANMFYGCSNLTTIPQLNTSNVTSMYRMFSECRKLTTIPQLNTSNVAEMSRMFFSCYELINIPQLDTSNATNMDAMFMSTKLLYLKINTDKNTKFSYFVSDCKELKLLDISRLHTSSSSSQYTQDIASRCYSLRAVVIRSFGTNYVLSDYAFTNSYKMLGTTNATYNPNGEQGYVYVPRDMIEILQSATNWSVLQFRALEDYTLDGTTSGELDFVKMGLEVE